MKKFLFALIFLFASAYCLLATEITIASKQINNWRYGGSTATLRIYAGKMFVTSDGKIVLPGSSATGGMGWYKEINCTVVGTTLYIPAISGFDTTTDSSVPTAGLEAVFFDQQNRKRDAFITNFRVPHNLGANITWQDVLTYNQQPQPPPPTGYYTNSQVNQLIASATANMVQTDDTRLVTNLESFGNSLSSAVGALGSADAVLTITEPVTVSSSLTIPKNIRLDVQGTGLITVAAGQTLTVGSMNDAGNRKIFTSTASGASVRFSKAAVERINIAWWTGQALTATDATDAINEANASCVANIGCTIYIPEGFYTTTGGHILADATIIQGAGNFPNNGYAGSNLKLVSPTASFMWKIGEGEYGVRFRDILFDGTGTTSKSGLLLQGTYPNSSGDLSIENVTFESFAVGFNFDDVEVGPNVNWQFAHIQMKQVIFQGNTIGMSVTSLNSEFALESVTFRLPDAGTAIYTNGIGTLLVKSSEFHGNAGTGYISGSKIIQIDGQHANIQFQNCQDEGINYFLVNNASDVQSVVTLNTNLIQSLIQINQSMTLLSTGNTYVPDAVTINAPAQPSFTSFNDVVRTDIGTFAAPGVIPANPLRLVASNNPITQFEFNPNFLYGSGTPDDGGMKVRHFAKFVLPAYLGGSESTPVVNIMDVASGSESQALLGLCRADDNQQRAFCYDFTRTNSGDHAGELVIAGNQTGFQKFRTNGRLFVEGAFNTQACQLTDAATITIDSQCGNGQYVTLQGNRTFAVTPLSAAEKVRANLRILTIEIIQDGTGSRTCTLSTGAGQFRFGSDITSITCSTTAGASDLLTVQYSAAKDRWLVKDFKKGF